MMLTHSPIKNNDQQQQGLTNSNMANVDNPGYSQSQPLNQPPQENLVMINTDLIAAIRKPRPPPFIKERPDVWFTLLEIEFHASNTRNDDTKYSTTLRHLDVDTI